MAGFVLVLYTVAVQPVRTAFYWDDNWRMEVGEIVDWWKGMDIFIDAFFLTDILLNFNTGLLVEEGPELIADRFRVAMAYLRGWFCLDMASSLPLDILIVGNKISILRIPRVLKLLRLSRLLRLLRLSRIMRYAERLPFFTLMSSFALRVFKLVLCGIAFLHWDACLQFLVVAATGYPEGSWVDKAGLEDASVFSQYTWSLFCALSHMLSTGYGLESPGTTAEAWTTLLSMVTGASLFCTFVGIITTLLIQLDAANTNYKNKIEVLNQYMGHRKLPEELKKRIRDSYEYRWNTRRVFDEMQLISELPVSLRRDVSLHMCRDLLANMPLFEHAEPGLITSLVVLLRPLTVLGGDLIISEKEVSREMYFIRSGNVVVEVNSKPVTTLRNGSFFGEMGILKCTLRTASVRALTPCELFTLTKTDFDLVLKDFPASRNAMDIIAEQRFMQLKSSKAYQENERGVQSCLRLSMRRNLGRGAPELLKTLSGGEGEERSLRSNRSSGRSGSGSGRSGSGSGSGSGRSACQRWRRRHARKSDSRVSFSMSEGGLLSGTGRLSLAGERRHQRRMSNQLLKTHIAPWAAGSSCSSEGRCSAEASRSSSGSDDAQGAAASGSSERAAAEGAAAEEPAADEEAAESVAEQLDSSRAAPARASEQQPRPSEKQA